MFILRLLTVMDLPIFKTQHNKYTNVTDRQTDRQTSAALHRHAIKVCNILLPLASADALRCVNETKLKPHHTRRKY